MNRLRIFFDLASLDPWHRRELEKRLTDADTSHAQVASATTDADCVIAFSTPWHFSSGGRWLGRPGVEHSHPPRFVWDQSDLPSGHERGFYCSLPRTLYDARRHRTGHYATTYNECVRPGDFSEASKLFGFVGGITSGLRSRLVRQLHTQSGNDFLCEQQHGPWTQMFDRSGLPIKQRYAAALRSCRFFLCPRGNGVGSVRLFETMESARVPVILSDAYVLPTGIDWARCSIRIKERELHRLPAILRSHDQQWQALASAARKTWEQHFSPQCFLTTIGGGVQALKNATLHPPPSHALRRAAFLCHLQLRRHSATVSRLLSPLLRKPKP